MKKRVSIEIGADLELWGPPFGGKVHLDCWVVELTIPIGEGKHNRSDTVASWEAFRGEMLPDHIFTLQVMEGLIREEKMEEEEGRWVVRPDAFAFFTESTIPLSEIEATILSKSYKVSHNLIDIRPTGQRDVPSVQTVTMNLVPNVTDDDFAQLPSWLCVCRESSVPEALWGEPIEGKPEQASAELIEKKLTGLRMQAPKKEESGNTCELRFTGRFQEISPNGGLPLNETSVQTMNVTQYCSLLEIECTIMHKDVVKKRDEVWGVLNTLELYQGYNRTLDQLACDADAYLAEPPMMQL